MQRRLRAGIAFEEASARPIVQPDTRSPLRMRMSMRGEGSGRAGGARAAQSGHRRVA